MRRPALLVALLLSLAARVRAEPDADGHMLAGAQYFRAGRYAGALVEFRVAERLGDPGAIWYAAATLEKLKRPEEAVAEFARAEVEAANERDGLLDYYRALACYDARLYFCADHLLAQLGQEPGPRIAAQAKKIRGDLAPLLATTPSAASVDWYHERGDEALKTGQLALSGAYYDEAVNLAMLRPDGYRRAEALAGLARARQRANTKAAAR